MSFTCNTFLSSWGQDICQQPSANCGLKWADKLPVASDRDRLWWVEPSTSQSELIAAKQQCCIEKDAGNWQQVEVFQFLLEAGCRICNKCVPIFSMRFLHEAIQLSWRSRGDLNIFGLSGSNGWFGPDGYSSFLAAPGRCSDPCLRILRQLQ